MIPRCDGRRGLRRSCEKGLRLRPAGRHNGCLSAVFHAVPDVLASTTNLLKVNGWQAGAPMTMGSQNFEVMREWNRSEVYRRTLVYFAEQLRQ
jgi:membrane-bound lytic murein transglycosylase B